MSTVLFLISAGYIFSQFGLTTTLLYALMYFFTMFGFCQIVGSIQHHRLRGIGKTFTTILIWSILLVIGYLIILNYFTDIVTVYYIALVAGFITSITSGRIR